MLLCEVVTGLYDFDEGGDVYPCTLSTNTLIGGLHCPSDYLCTRYWIGPHYGIVSFDNIGLAMLTVFTVITMSSWTSVMYYVSPLLFFLPIDASRFYLYCYNYLLTDYFCQIVEDLTKCRIGHNADYSSVQ